MEIWRGESPAAADSPAASADVPSIDFTVDPDDTLAPWPERVLTILLALAAVGWVAAVAWRAWAAFADGLPDLPALVTGAATLSMPLALIGIAFLILRRTSRREARRFGVTAAAMRAEAAALERTLATLSDRITTSRRDLGDHAHQLLLLGDDAAVRLGEISNAMQDESDRIADHGDRLEQVAKGARADMDALLADLPRAGGEAEAIAALLREAGLGAHEQAAGLAAALALVAQRGREAEDPAGGAAQRLSAHLARIEGVATTAGDRLAGAAGQIGEAVDAALANAAQAVEEARRAIEAQAAARLALAEQGRAAMEQAGAEAAQALAARLDEIDARVAGLARTIAAQADAGGALVDRLDAGLDEIAQRVDALGEAGTTRGEALAASVEGVATRIAQVGAAIDDSNAAAATLTDRAERIDALLRDGSAAMRVDLPEALDLLERRVNQSHAALAALGPQATKLAAAADDAATKLGSADALLLRQATTMRALGLAAEERLAGIEAHAASLEAAVATGGEQIRQLVDGAGPKLIEALLRVRETAVQAADHARDAFATIVPEAAGALGDAARRTLAEAFDDGIEAQMADVAAASERAVVATHRATERLMRQMLTIADTTAVIEQRLADARAEAEESDEDAFSRRVAALIEQLNSTAINVTGMLSQEVSEAAWATYLKGERGIFTRRAVKLLDGGEVREIQRLYERDGGFRDQVNRYVHDFEAMLRRVLSAREGSQIGVTLLSSDMGKLYVALAQAIDRLRT